MIIAILLTSGALVVLAWLIFNLAIYALPFFVGVSAASWANAHGSRCRQSRRHRTLRWRARLSCRQDREHHDPLSPR